VNASHIGSYSIEVDGRSGQLFHYATVSVSIRPPDFSLPPNPGALTISVGGSGSAAITIVPPYDFKGTVTVLATVTPHGPTVPLSSTIITDGSGSSTLTISIDSAVHPGNYTVTIFGKSADVVRSAQLPLSIQPMSSGPIIGLPASTFYALVGGGIVAVALAGFLVLRARKKTASTAV